MKRGADNQLTKDGGSDDEPEELTGEGFRKADGNVLASRPMRGLPKRSLAGVPPPAAPSTTTQEASSAPAPKFTGFAGFSAPSNNSFTFTPPASSNFVTPPSSFAPSTSAPVVTESASNTAKTFASFLGNPSAKPDAAPNPPPQKNMSSTTDIEVDDPAALKYYTSLRGLNVSFLAALNKATEEDPFKDVSELLDTYKNLRLNIQKEFDQRPKSSTTPAPPPKPTAMPAPPTTFLGFGPPPTSTASATSGGNAPSSTTPSSSSGFSFAPSFSSVPPASTSGFSFATPPATQATSTINSFALPSSDSPSPFGTSIFGGTSSSAFGTAGKPTSSSGSFTFGSPSAVPASSTNAFGNSASSSTSGLFGTSNAFGSPPKANPFGGTGFGGFGKPAGGVGSIGNPVGFGFGSPPRSTPGADVGDSNSIADEGGENNGSTEGGAKPERAASSGLLVNNPHDEEGEGEEQEDTVYSVKLKAYRLKKDDEKGGAGWLELGYGVLRIKKHTETEARRVLLRNSSTGKININFNLYSGLKPTQSKKTISFVGHQDGVSQTYSVRLQSEEQAAALKDALDKEIAAVKAKSDD